MTKRKTGFTLIEIMVAIFVLVIGMMGILALFPRGIRETKAAVEETQAALIAQSVYNALRSSVRQMTDANLRFFYDGMDPTRAYNMSALAAGNSYGIPNHDADATGASVATGTYAADPRNRVDSTAIPQFQSYCQLARGADATQRFNIPYAGTSGQFSQDDADQLRQYSFNIQLSRPTGNPAGLFDVAIHVRRGVGSYGKIVRSFYTQITIPTN